MGRWDWEYHVVSRVVLPWDFDIELGKLRRLSVIGGFLLSHHVFSSALVFYLYIFPLRSFLQVLNLVVEKSAVNSLSFALSSA